MNTLTWLVRREYWENRGGFLWAPFWVSASILLVTILGIITAEVAGQSANIHVGVSLKVLMDDVSSNQLAAAGASLDGVQLAIAAMCLFAMGFVLFFYLLGSLYDDRRDRSVLFWKSLPLSDTQMVAGKVIAATLLAPVITIAVATAAYVVFLLITTIWAAFHGASLMPAIAASHPLRVLGNLLLLVPVNALWALPTVGWLMLSSAWARSKPFLWATLVPLGAWVALLWFSLIGGGVRLINNETLAFILTRLLAGTWPGNWLFSTGLTSTQHVIQGDATSLGPLNWPDIWGVMGTTQLWLGVLAGMAMIAIATWLRGRRIETNS